jgi:ketosteroid isomerase-like protein
MADVLDAIERFWEARLEGDTAAIHAMLAPEATYAMNGSKDFGNISAKVAVDVLVGAFRFHGRESLTVIVDGLQVAAVDRLQVSYRGGEPVVTEACDLWQFDGEGKIVSLKQYVDTDLVRRMTDGAV